MKTFRCDCGNTLHFENSQCLACGRTVGYAPDRHVLCALESAGGDLVTPASGGGRYRRCGNWAQENVCNWLVPEADPNPLCAACRLNRIIPNLSEPRNRMLWSRIEAAKRRLLYTLYALHLPVEGRDVNPARGLAFEFLADTDPSLEFADNAAGRRIMTGHQAGLITVNLAEADDTARERMRERMQELYRTLLGHFRHESGHYYWARMIDGTPRLEIFRNLFGDERADYAAALERHYAEAGSSDWEGGYISAYAAAHPWEDWAETWAHYLHMVDTLETAHDLGLRLGGRELAAPTGPDGPAGNFNALLSDWSHVTAAMNALNRSMGLPDPYPFVLSKTATEKLAFVHRVIAGR